MVARPGVKNNWHYAGGEQQQMESASADRPTYSQRQPFPESPHHQSRRCDSRVPAVPEYVAAPITIQKALAFGDRVCVGVDVCDAVDDGVTAEVGVPVDVTVKAAVDDAVDVCDADVEVGVGVAPTLSVADTAAVTVAVGVFVTITFVYENVLMLCDSKLPPLPWLGQRARGTVVRGAAYATVFDRARTFRLGPACACSGSPSACETHPREAALLTDRAAEALL